MRRKERRKGVKEDLSPSFTKGESRGLRFSFSEDSASFPFLYGTGKVLPWDLSSEKGLLVLGSSSSRGSIETKGP